MFDSDLCYGFLLGFLSAGAVGFISQRLLLLRKKAGQAGKKIAVVEIKQSPREAVRTSAKARTEMMFWILILALAVIAVVWIYLS